MKTQFKKNFLLILNFYLHVLQQNSGFCIVYLAYSNVYLFSQDHGLILSEFRLLHFTFSILLEIIHLRSITME